MAPSRRWISRMRLLGRGRPGKSKAMMLSTSEVSAPMGLAMKRDATAINAAATATTAAWMASDQGSSRVAGASNSRAGTLLATTMVVPLRSKGVSWRRRPGRPPSAPCSECPDAPGRPRRSPRRAPGRACPCFPARARHRAVRPGRGRRNRPAGSRHGRRSPRVRRRRPAHVSGSPTGCRAGCRCRRPVRDRPETAGSW